ANMLRFVRSRRRSIAGSIARRRTDALNLYASDSFAVHLDHAKAIVAILKAFASARNETQLIEDETAHSGIGGILGKRDVVLGVQVANVQSGVENDRAIRESKWALDDIELVVNFANDLLENVFQGDQAENAAEFVHHDGQADVVGAQLDQ